MFISTTFYPSFFSSVQIDSSLLIFSYKSPSKTTLPNTDTFKVVTPISTFICLPFKLLSTLIKTWSSSKVYVQVYPSPEPPFLLFGFNKFFFSGSSSSLFSSSPAFSVFSSTTFLTSTFFSAYFFKACAYCFFNFAASRFLFFSSFFSLSKASLT